MSTIYTFNNKVLKNSANDKWLTKKETPIDPYNPLGLPAGVMRVKVQDGWTASGYDTSSLNFTQLSASPNIWDITVKKGTGINNWNISQAGIIEIMGFNPEGVTGYGSGIKYIIGGTSTKVGAMRLPEITDLSSSSFSSTVQEVGPLSLPNVTSLSATFQGKQQLRYVELNELGNLESCVSTFYACTFLTSMPVLNGLLKVTDVTYMFDDCLNVESGILDMYNRLNSLGTVTTTTGCFNNCGRDTVTGAAELAQIPSDWGGTGA